jgi:hypothetical protein
MAKGNNDLVKNCPSSLLFPQKSEISQKEKPFAIITGR